jgi:hypothetical protein
MTNLLASMALAVTSIFTVAATIWVVLEFYGIMKTL